jgi:orotate phosphoribosyltransferase
VTEKQILKIFLEKNALLTGHFLLSSGLHSDKYLQCAKVLQYPGLAHILCKQLAVRFKKKNPTVVLAPALGGVVVSFEVARALRARSIFAERQGDRFTLRRGFDLSEGDRVLIVEDVVTTGASVKELISLATLKGAELVGVGAIINRATGDLGFNVRFETLLGLNIATYPPRDCPFCKEGLRLVKPGSRAISAEA